MAARFGAGGFRGILGLDVTAAGIRELTRAAAAWLGGEGQRAGAKPLLLLAHDTRWLGSRMVDIAVGALAEFPLRVLAARGPTPTPVVVHQVRARGASGALIFTASHNPPSDHGVKIVGPDGVAAPTRVVRTLAAASGRAHPVVGRPRLRRLPARSLREAYLAGLRRALGGAPAARSRVRVFYDPLCGAGGGTVEPAVEAIGARVVWRGGRPEPGLGGRPPDPVPGRLRRLAEAVRAGGGVRIGVATDGDADRFAVVDERGRVRSETDAAALLVDHLAATGRIPPAGAVVLSPFVGGLAERTARDRGLAVHRRPPGFRHLALALASGGAAAAADESGGFAWAPHGVDKDGILASLLAVEAVALTGEGPAKILQRIRRRVGDSDCGRTAVAATPGRRAALAALRRDPPDRVCGERVLEADGDHGLLLRLRDGFLGLRSSGTEPRIRIYADAPSPRLLEARLRAGVRLLGAPAARGTGGVDASPADD